MAESEDISSSSTKAVAVMVPSDILPKFTVPLVVIGLEPTLIAPKPDVMLPAFKAPVVTMFAPPTLLPAI